MATAVPSRLQTDFKSTVQVMGNIPPDTSKNPVMNSLETSCRILVAFIFFSPWVFASLFPPSQRVRSSAQCVCRAASPTCRR